MDSSYDSCLTKNVIKNLISEFIKIVLKSDVVKYMSMYTYILTSVYTVATVGTA